MSPSRGRLSGPSAPSQHLPHGLPTRFAQPNARRHTAVKCVSPALSRRAPVAEARGRERHRLRPRSVHAAVGPDRQDLVGLDDFASDEGDGAHGITLRGFRGGWMGRQLVDGTCELHCACVGVGPCSQHSEG